MQCCSNFSEENPQSFFIEVNKFTVLFWTSLKHIFLPSYFIVNSVQYSLSSLQSYNILVIELSFKIPYCKWQNFTEKSFLCHFSLSVTNCSELIQTAFSSLKWSSISLHHHIGVKTLAATWNKAGLEICL